MIRQVFLLSLVSCQSGLIASTITQPSRQPNILFVISDDQSFPYASAYGVKGVNTPNFDRVAKQGILFTNAFVTSPGCSPSRASILTGRYPWQIEEAGTHASSFPKKYKTFTGVLEENGYAIGFTGKPWAPGDWAVSGWKQNPVGTEFNQIKLKPMYSGISKIDYSGNFGQFMKQRKPDQPFFFWFGAHEPHRSFEKGSWQKENKSESNARVPRFLPDHPVVRCDLLDYAVEIEWYDQQLGKILRKLEETGEFENTLIIITSDNGMPFPRAKANCYDAGIHVPMAISWASHITAGQVVDNLVSTVDLAPTILEAAGLQFNGTYPMTGKSQMKQLCAKKYPVQNAGQEIFAGRERHSSARYENRGYPQRVIRTDHYLYVRNYHPEYWPSGDPQVILNDGSLSEMHQAYLDIDDGPTLKFYKNNNVQNPEYKPYFSAAMDKRHSEELYDIQNDPDCMTDLAQKPKYAGLKKQLSERLIQRLKETGDTREIGSNPEIWETYPRLQGEIRKFPKPTSN